MLFRVCFLFGFGFVLCFVFFFLNKADSALKLQHSFFLPSTAGKKRMTDPVVKCVSASFCGEVVALLLVQCKAM